jgi:hypothetical protein
MAKAIASQLPFASQKTKLIVLYELSKFNINLPLAHLCRAIFRYSVS